MSGSKLQHNNQMRTYLSCSLLGPLDQQDQEVSTVHFTRFQPNSQVLPHLPPTGLDDRAPTALKLQQQRIRLRRCQMPRLPVRLIVDSHLIIIKPGERRERVVRTEQVDPLECRADQSVMIWWQKCFKIVCKPAWWSAPACLPPLDSSSLFNFTICSNFRCAWVLASWPPSVPSCSLRWEPWVPSSLLLLSSPLLLLFPWWAATSPDADEKCS